MRHCAALLASVLAVAGALPSAQQKPLFSFHSNAWLNLHHYVRASARGGGGPAGLSDEQQQQWQAGVAFYKPYAARDVLRDDGMVAIASALRDAEGKTSLDGIAIEAPLKAMLERLMPIYRTRGWPEHDRANREWIATIVPLVDRHGAAISQSLTRVVRHHVARRAHARRSVRRRRSRRRVLGQQSHYNLVLRPELPRIRRAGDGVSRRLARTRTVRCDHRAAQSHRC